MLEKMLELREAVLAMGLSENPKHDDNNNNTHDNNNNNNIYITINIINIKINPKNRAASTNGRYQRQPAHKPHRLRKEPRSGGKGT